ncbi:Unsaturated rhamnogalacturonyl hydrolase YteR [Poriferisphaera corsica]|uniref:Unsaturated rhamnogalacturonyl hydrolase YteR n=1 Tax=Poriferisphaera corsica TaxID=2528020 RepID=A0A517YVG5_9BACT|nr:glycoside hydrolase family 88 protein [Poriferisphaera corsica]QDU34231.1 Unsaturated rhamnogalacturonyl hydrolase YteR [Poriferisphaera corsica]
MSKLVLNFALLVVLVGVDLKFIESVHAAKTSVEQRQIYDHYEALLEPEQIKQIGYDVFWWQIMHMDDVDRRRDDWVFAPFYIGAIRFAETTGQQSWLSVMKRDFEAIDWRFGFRPRHADDWAIGWAYAMLYEREKKAEMIDPMVSCLDDAMQKSYDESLEFRRGIVDRELAWCDALFMGPPTLMKMYRLTGDMKYLKFQHKLWWKTTEYLYDTDEKLYFRDSRYFDKREPNGKKVFWSRGNGWVLAGLANVIELMPVEDPQRERYEKLYVDMAERIAGLQMKNGFWPIGLLDEEKWRQSEASGTAFFVYGLAWGVNQGYLPREKYTSVIVKGYQALTQSITADGKLENVQPIGKSPYDFDASSTMPYGVGALLLALDELYELSLK